VGMRFSPRPDQRWEPPSLLYNGYRVFPRGIGGRGPRKSRAIPLLTLRAFVAYEKGENLHKKGSTDRVLKTLIFAFVCSLGVAWCSQNHTETYCFNELLVYKFHTSTICLENSFFVYRMEVMNVDSFSEWCVISDHAMKQRSFSIECA